MIIKSSNELKIEEVLELFPKKKTVLTGQMKEHLCSVLDDYDEKLKIMRTQTEAYSLSIEKLRKKQIRQRNKILAIKPGLDCCICFRSIFN